MASGRWPRFPVTERPSVLIDSAEVAKSRLETDIFDDRISLWSDTAAVLIQSLNVESIYTGITKFKISPDSSKILVYNRGINYIVLRDSVTMLEISRLNLNSAVLVSPMSFSSDGGIVVVQTSDKERGSSDMLVISIPGLEIVKRVPVECIPIDKIVFIKGSNSEILVFTEDICTVELFNLSTMSKVWGISDIVYKVFELTKDGSKFLLSTVQETPEGMELVLVDARTGEFISRMAYPQTNYIDCAVFSDDERKVILSLNCGHSIQIIDVPFDAGQPENVISGGLNPEGGRISHMIVSPDANLVMRIGKNKLSIVDLKENALKMETGHLGYPAFYKGVEVSSNRSIIVYGASNHIMMIYTRHGDQRRLAAILDTMFELMLASRRRRIRLPSEIWRLIAEEFLKE